MLPRTIIPASIITQTPPGTHNATTRPLKATTKQPSCAADREPPSLEAGMPGELPSFVCRQPPLPSLPQLAPHNPPPQGLSLTIHAFELYVTNQTLTK
jgi:hypothetical protein